MSEIPIPGNPFKEIRVIISLVFTALFAAAVIFTVQHYQNLERRAVIGDQRGLTIQSANGVIDDTVTIQKENTDTENDVAKALEEYRKGLGNEKHNNPVVRNRDTRAIPDSLRKLARQRRLTRERLDRLEVGDNTDGKAESSGDR